MIWLFEQTKLSSGFTELGKITVRDFLPVIFLLPWMDGLLDGLLGGWVARWMGGRVDGWPEWLVGVKKISHLLIPSNPFKTYRAPITSRNLHKP